MGFYLPTIYQNVISQFPTVIYISESVSKLNQALPVNLDSLLHIDNSQKDHNIDRIIAFIWKNYDEHVPTTVVRTHYGTSSYSVGCYKGETVAFCCPQLTIQQQCIVDLETELWSKSKNKEQYISTEERTKQLREKLGRIIKDYPRIQSA